MDIGKANLYVTKSEQVRNLHDGRSFVTYISHFPGRWNKPSDGEPTTKYEIVWSGSLAIEEG